MSHSFAKTPTTSNAACHGPRPELRFSTPFRRRHVLLCLCLVTLVGASGCATLEQIANLAEVDFRVDGTSQGALAGVPIERLSRFDQLRAIDLLRLGAALRNDSLPLSFTLHVAASNPSGNGVAASLVALDWRLLVRDRETIRGQFSHNTELPPGQTVDLPIPIELDLRRFFDEDLRELVDVALSAAGKNSDGSSLRLMARPTIQTPLGPIQYPGEITIASR